MIYTDDLKILTAAWATWRTVTRIARINHRQGIYVQGDVHTDIIKGFSSLVKRGIGGTHHMVSLKFVQEVPERIRFPLQSARRSEADGSTDFRAGAVEIARLRSLSKSPLTPCKRPIRPL
jgi:hypothetical protein